MTKEFIDDAKLLDEELAFITGGANTFICERDGDIVRVTNNGQSQNWNIKKWEKYMSAALKQFPDATFVDEKGNPFSL